MTSASYFVFLDPSYAWRWDQDQASFLVFLQHCYKIRACTGKTVVIFSIRSTFGEFKSLVLKHHALSDLRHISG